MKAYIKEKQIFGEVVEMTNGVVTKVRVKNPVTGATEIISTINDTVIIIKGLMTIARLLRELWRIIKGKK